MIPLLLLLIATTAAGRTAYLQPSQERPSADTVYKPPSPGSAFMQMAYNMSIPGDEVARCEALDRVACPTKARGAAGHKCIRPAQLCDRVANCENGEDENRTLCMFYRMHMFELRRLRELTTMVYGVAQKNEDGRKYIPHYHRDRS